MLAKKLLDQRQSRLFLLTARQQRKQFLVRTEDSASFRDFLSSVSINDSWDFEPTVGSRSPHSITFYRGFLELKAMHLTPAS